MLLTGNIIYDALASISIGFLLSGVSFFMAIKCKSLIVRESADKGEIDQIEKSLNSKSYLLSFDKPKTLHFGPESILLAIDVSFKDNLEVKDIEKYTIEIENNIRSINHHYDRIYIEARKQS